MPSWLKHVGLAVAGVACIGVSVFFPPAAPILGPIGTKLALAGGGSVLLGIASPDHIKTAVQVVTGIAKK